MALPVFGIANLATVSLGSAPPAPIASSMFSTDAKYAAIIRAINTNAITHIRFSALLSAGTSPIYRASIQGVTSNGIPDGSIKASGNAYGTFQPVSSTPSIFEVALSSSYTPTLDEALAIVFDYSSGTLDFSNYSTLIASMGGIAPITHKTAVASDFGGGFSVVAGVPVASVKTASERYGGIVCEWAGVGVSSVLAPKETTTSGNRVAAKILVPAADYIDSLSLSGFLMAFTPTAGQTIKAGAWNAAGTELKAVTLDTDTFASFATNAIEFDTPLSIAPGGTIYIGFESVSSSSAKIDVFDFDNTDDRDCVGSVLSGSNIIYSAWNGSAWTDSATDVPPIQINLSGITGAAGGGGASNPFGSLIR